MLRFQTSFIGLISDRFRDLCFKMQLTPPGISGSYLSPNDRIQYPKPTNIQNSAWHSPVSCSKLRIGEKKKSSAEIVDYKFLLLISTSVSLCSSAI